MPNMPEEKEGRGETQPEMKLAHRVAPGLVTEVVKRVPGERKQTDRGQELS